MLFLPTTSDIVPVLVFLEIDRRRSTEPTVLETVDALMQLKKRNP